MLITGLIGSGKSHLACTLAYQACLLGYRTMYYDKNRFIEKVCESRFNGSYLKQLDHRERAPLIVLDDFGLQAIDQKIKITLLNLHENRYAKSP